MKTQQLDFSATGKFSTIFMDYISQNQSLTPFYGLFPTIENFAEQLEAKQKNYPEQNRQVLHDALQNQ